MTTTYGSIIELPAPENSSNSFRNRVQMPTFRAIASVLVFYESVILAKRPQEAKNLVHALKGRDSSSLRSSE